MDNKLIVVKQLPIIEQQLKSIKADIVSKVEKALSLECTNDSVKTIKTVRAELSKDFKDFEDKRKEVKRAVMAPYEAFENTYKDCITDVYKSADSELKSKIGKVENELKYQKELEITSYFNEYAASKNIDFLSFADANINVTLSVSVKSLKEQAKAFIDRICDDLALVDTQEDKTEIMVEYKKSLNVSSAITMVSERHKAIENEKARKVEFETIKAEENKVIEKVESVSAPVVEEVEEKEYTLTFSVTATMDKLKALKQFLKDGGYQYE